MATPSQIGRLVDRGIQVGQLVALIGGIVVVSFKVGARDQIITNHTDGIAELKSIVKEISATQVSMLAFDATSASDRAAMDRRIEDIRERLAKLESKQ